MSSLGREGSLGLGAGFDSVFLRDGVETLGSGAFFGGATALGVGGVLGRELFFSDLDDFSAFSDFDFSDFSVFEDFSGFDADGVLVFDGADGFDAVAVLEDLDFDGVDGVGFSGGDVLALNESKGLGHAPMAFGVSSTIGASFFDLEVFAGVFGSGAAFVAAEVLSGAPLLPVATGGGGAASGTAASPNSCRALSFTLGNIVCESPGWYD